MGDKKEHQIDGDELLRSICSGQMKVKLPAERPSPSDFSDVVHATQWITILAVPRMFHGMSRMPEREHLLRLLDIYIAYVRRGDRYMGADFAPVPYEEREPLALRLRALLESWKPPDLPRSVVETARALLHAEGTEEPTGGWDNLPDPGPDLRPEDVLLWPDGVPALQRQSEGPTDRRRHDP